MLPSSNQPLALVGTYTEAGGPGLCPVYRTGDDGLRLGHPLSQAPNASYGVYSHRYGLHYLVDESEEGAVGAYRWNGREMEQLASIATRGAEPCYVSLDPAETALAVANYASGSCTVLRLDEATGLPGGEVIVRRNAGSGPVGDRQEGPHAHCAIFSPSGDWLFQTDLGTDEVLAFSWHSDSGELGASSVVYRAPSGSGPRHLLFNRDGSLAYLVCELAASITVLRVEAPRFIAHQTLPLLAEHFTDENLGGHLQFDPSNRRLIATNRGHDSLAWFDIQDDGTLRRGALAGSGGRSPRHFGWAAEELLVVNEESGSIRRLAAEGDNWTLAGGPLRVPGAAFLITEGLRDRGSNGSVNLTQCPPRVPQ
ncbi:lactonase family protein [Tsuneonella sp. HG249]